MAQDKVKMTHSKMSGVTYEAPRSAVPFHIASGWKPEDGKLAAAEKPDASASEPATDEADGAKSTPKRTASKES